MARKPSVGYIYGLKKIEYMETTNQQLGFIRSENDMTGLFRDWYEQVKHENGEDDISFVCDGVMYKREKDELTTEKDWKESTKRIAFLLKDQNQDGFSWVDDTRKWLVCRDDNWNVESKFLRNIANALWGIKVSSPQYLPDPKSVKQYHEDITECFRSTPFAFVECKKQGGVSKLSNKALKTYLGKDEYKDLLYREFDILDANIFVCTNPFIYEFVQVYLTKRKCPGTQMTRVNSVSEKDKLEASVALHLPSKSIVLCSYHPSAIMSYENFFKGVVTHYQAFVQSPYYDEFFN